MSQAGTLVEPVVEVRDVVEPFLVDAVVVSHWQSSLSDAADRFTQLGMTELGAMVGELAANGMAERVALTREVSTKIAELLDALPA